MAEDIKIEHWNPYDLVDHDNQNQEEWKTTPEEKKSENFFQKIINAIKRIGASNTKTWDATQDKNTSLENQDEKKKFNFENVMSWVTWVLNKIEKKIEEKNDNQELQETPESEIEKNNEEYLSENH